MLIKIFLTVFLVNIIVFLMYRYTNIKANAFSDGLLAMSFIVSIVSILAIIWTYL